MPNLRNSGDSDSEETDSSVDLESETESESESEYTSEENQSEKVETSPTVQTEHAVNNGARKGDAVSGNTGAEVETEKSSEDKDTKEDVESEASASAEEEEEEKEEDEEAGEGGQADEGDDEGSSEDSVDFESSDEEADEAVEVEQHAGQSANQPEATTEVAAKHPEEPTPAVVEEQAKTEAPPTETVVASMPEQVVEKSKAEEAKGEDKSNAAPEQVAVSQKSSDTTSETESQSEDSKESDNDKTADEAPKESATITNEDAVVPAIVNTDEVKAKEIAKAEESHVEAVKEEETGLPEAPKRQSSITSETEITFEKVHEEVITTVVPPSKESNAGASDKAAVDVADVQKPDSDCVKDITDAHPPKETAPAEQPLASEKAAAQEEEVVKHESEVVAQLPKEVQSTTEESISAKTEDASEQDQSKPKGAEVAEEKELKHETPNENGAKVENTVQPLQAIASEHAPKSEEVTTIQVDEKSQSKRFTESSPEETAKPVAADEDVKAEDEHEQKPQEDKQAPAKVEESAKVEEPTQEVTTTTMVPETEATTVTADNSEAAPASADAPHPEVATPVTEKTLESPRVADVAIVAEQTTAQNVGETKTEHIEEIIPPQPVDVEPVETISAEVSAQVQAAPPSDDALESDKEKKKDKKEKKEKKEKKDKKDKKSKVSKDKQAEESEDITDRATVVAAVETVSSIKQPEEPDAAHVASTKDTTDAAQPTAVTQVEIKPLEQAPAEEQPIEENAAAVKEEQKHAEQHQEDAEVKTHKHTEEKPASPIQVDTVEAAVEHKAEATVPEAKATIPEPEQKTAPLPVAAPEPEKVDPLEAAQRKLDSGEKIYSSSMVNVRSLVTRQEHLGEILYKVNAGFSNLNAEIEILKKQYWPVKYQYSTYARRSRVKSLIY